MQLKIKCLTKNGGHSSIVDPWGNFLSKAGDNETIITAELNMEIVDKIRSTINIYNDRRSDLYTIK